MRSYDSKSLNNLPNEEYLTNAQKLKIEWELKFNSIDWVDGKKTIDDIRDNKCEHNWQPIYKMSHLNEYKGEAFNCKKCNSLRKIYTKI